MSQGQGRVPGATVVVPVGPLPEHQTWLQDCLDSVAQQTVPVALMVVSDMAELPEWFVQRRMGVARSDGLARTAGSVVDCAVHWNEWRLGVSASYNIGVSLAGTDRCFLLGADDTLHPECIERCLEAADKAAFNAVGDAPVCVRLRYMDTGELQDIQCNAMMVSREWWKLQGGFSVEAFTASDTMLHSMILAEDGLANYTLGVAASDGSALYNYRRHPHTDTSLHGDPRWQQAIFAIRDVLTERRADEWTSVARWTGWQGWQ